MTTYQVVGKNMEYVFSGKSISHTSLYFLFHPVNYYRSVGRVSPFPDVDQHSRLDVTE